MSHQTEWENKYWEKYGRLAIDPLANGLKDFIATLIAEEREKAYIAGQAYQIEKEASTMIENYKNGVDKERTRIVEILKKQDTHLSVVEEDNRDYICLDEALLAITEQK